MNSFEGHYAVKVVYLPRETIELRFSNIDSLFVTASKLFTKEGNVVFSYSVRGGAVASWLVRSTPDRALRVRALAWDIVLCS